MNHYITCPAKRGAGLCDCPESKRTIDAAISKFATCDQPRSVNPRFHQLLARMATIHDKKSQDYANDGNRYANFEEAAASAGCSVDTVFAVLIGIKLARLKELTGSGKTPNNESVQDSRLDLAVYSALWASYHEVASS